jgi:crotonobetainyl-CoA:carnitine CoA-transferase CaiB-like acyl-CoA transferase
MFWPGRGEVPGRFGYGERTSTQKIFTGSFYRCKDGWVAGMDARRRWAPMVAWLSAAGWAEGLDDPRYLDQTERDAVGAKIQDVLERFTASRTMEELVEEGQQHGMFVFPTYTAREIVNDRHLKERGFFTPVAGPNGEELIYPGPPYRLSETPARLRPAPRLGQDNEVVFHAELGVAKERLADLKRAGVI